MKHEYIFIKRVYDDAPIQPVVLVHGLNGKAEGMMDRCIEHIDRHLKINTLLVLPTYTAPYQFLGDGEDKELLSEIRRFTRERSSYHQKLCIYGFSAGAQFAHRFTYVHPDKVACVGVFSAGSWTYPDGTYSDHPGQPGYVKKSPYNTPYVYHVSTRKAKRGIANVRWFTGCGRQDVRYERTRAFFASLRQDVPDARFISFNAGHRATDHVYKTVFTAFRETAQTA